MDSVAQNMKCWAHVEIKPYPTGNSFSPLKVKHFCSQLNSDGEICKDVRNIN